MLDNLSTGFAPLLPPAAELFVGDCSDQELVASLMRSRGVDSIIHLAASIVVPESVRDPLRYYRNNTVNSHALIETSIMCGVHHFVFSSTAAVYGDPVDLPISEDAPLVPVSPYGRSKLMTEAMLCDASAAYGLNYAILRYSTWRAPIRAYAPVSQRPQGSPGRAAQASSEVRRPRHV